MSTPSLSAEVQQALLDAMPAEIALLDATGHITYVNAAWREFGDANGLAVPAHCVGANYLAACAGARGEDATTARAIADLLEGRIESTTLEYACHSDNEERWFLQRGIAFGTREGRRVLVMHVDITERYRAARQLARMSLETERRERMLNTMLASITDLTYATDAQGNLLYANPGALGIWDCTLEQARGKNVTDLRYPQEAGAKLNRQIRQVFATGVPVRDEMPITDVDGRERYFEYIFCPALAPDGSVEIMVGAARDTTERKRAEQTLRELNEGLEERVRERTAQLALARAEAEQANAAKSAFLAAMSHEIRTPMSGMLGLLELLDLSPLNEEQRSTLDVARKSGEALKQIIDGILDFSRIEAGSLELNLAPCSIAELMNTISRLHAPVAASKGVELACSVDPSISRLSQCDALRLSQILNNFAGNAVKFTERGRVDIDVRLVQRDAGLEHLEFRVKDTGIGVSPQRMGRLFLPFSQADSKIAGRYGGSGLGLFIARSLAELMGGTVSLDSEVGVGTTLTLAVAFRRCDEDWGCESFSEAQRLRLHVLAASRPPAPSIEDAQAQGSLLLVVDDHPINRVVLLRQLSTLGYAAQAVADGPQALRAWESGRFAAIITDCNMPEMDGFELTRTIREREAEGVRIPIVGCTANAQASSAAACLAAGMDAAVIKPVTLETLCEALDRWVPLPSVRRHPDWAPPETAFEALPAGSAGLIDIALVTAISCGDPEKRAQIVADFRRNNDEDATALRRAVATGDRQKLVGSVHRLRGAAAMLGATYLAQACADLQASATGGDAAALAADLDTFEMEFLRVNNFLDGWLGPASDGRGLGDEGAAMH
ncbi:ATP-binding protein [Ramlibacter sp.]|uniref:PAS domain-containing hybrid sensor histidine kinase/response regulator n=1 Tax=Ramlibacter sp. TaxID=1917967 RepID=UPI003D0FF674